MDSDNNVKCDKTVNTSKVNSFRDNKRASKRINNTVHVMVKKCYILYNAE